MKTLFVVASVLALTSASALAQDTNTYILDSYTYAVLDTDDDNLMTADELQTAIPTITSSELKRIDADGDGMIRYDEFSNSPVILRYYDNDAITLPTTSTVSVERSYFTGIDRNRNGVLEEDELMEISSAVTSEIYGTLDSDEDGVVAYDELYGTEWFADAMEAETIITPAYVARYYAPETL